MAMQTQTHLCSFGFDGCSRTKVQVGALAVAQALNMPLLGDACPHGLLLPPLKCRCAEVRSLVESDNVPPTNHRTRPASVRAGEPRTSDPSLQGPYDDSCSVFPAPWAVRRSRGAARDRRKRYASCLALESCARGPPESGGWHHWHGARVCGGGGGGGRDRNA